MTEDTSLEEHLTTFKEIIADLKTLDVKYDKEIIGLFFFCSLPASHAGR